VIDIPLCQIGVPVLATVGLEDQHSNGDLVGSSRQGQSSESVPGRQETVNLPGYPEGLSVELKEDFHQQIAFGTSGEVAPDAPVRGIAVASRSVSEITG
jgi:hypothetical protein